MDWHVELARSCFPPPARSSSTSPIFYFHNCPYEAVWTENRRRHEERIPLLDVIRTYPSDYRVVFVGDASMSPYEIAHPGGSVEHWNEEAGAVWISGSRPLRESGLAQPDPGGALGLHPIDRHDAAPDVRPHVPADAGGSRRRDAGRSCGKSGVPKGLMQAARNRTDGPVPCLRRTPAAPPSRGPSAMRQDHRRLV